MGTNLNLVRERPAIQQKLLGIGHEAYYSKIRSGHLPKLMKDGRMSFGFQHEREIIAAATGKSEHEIIELVKELEALRPKLLAARREALHNALAA